MFGWIKLIPRKVWMVAAGVAVVSAAGWYVYDMGYDAATQEWQAKMSDAKADAVDDYHEALQQDRALTDPWWESDREREQEVRVVEKEVTRYVQENPDAAERECFDDRMLELWNGVQRRSVSPGDETAE